MKSRKMRPGACFKIWPWDLFLFSHANGSLFFRCCFTSLSRFARARIFGAKTVPNSKKKRVRGYEKCFQRPLVFCGCIFCCEDMRFSTGPMGDCTSKCGKSFSDVFLRGSGKTKRGLIFERSVCGGGRSTRHAPILQESLSCLFFSARTVPKSKIGAVAR